MRFRKRLALLLAPAALAFEPLTVTASEVVWATGDLIRYTNLHKKTDRASAAVKIHDYLKNPLYDLNPLPQPDKALMHMYQQKRNYQESLVLINTRESARLHEELDRDKKLIEIQRFHARERVLSDLNCLKRIASLSRDEEFKCYYRLRLSLINDREITRRQWIEFNKDSEEPFEIHALSYASGWLEELAFGALGAAKLRFEVLIGCMEGNFNMQLAKCEKKTK